MALVVSCTSSRLSRSQSRRHRGVLHALFEYVADLAAGHGFSSLSRREQAQLSVQ
jgi:hypothetical protein